MSDEDNLFVIYVCARNEIGGQKTVKLTFDHCITYSFGAPNDEVIHGHPLWDFGLKHYSSMEVFNSPKISELCKQNSVHHSHTNSLFDGLRHFIFTFHDSTVEVVARGISVEKFELNKFAEVIGVVASQIQNSHQR